MSDLKLIILPDPLERRGMPRAALGFALLLLLGLPVLLAGLTTDFFPFVQLLPYSFALVLFACGGLLWAFRRLRPLDDVLNEPLSDAEKEAFAEVADVIGDFKMLYDSYGAAGPQTYQEGLALQQALQEQVEIFRNDSLSGMPLGESEQQPVKPASSQWLPVFKVLGFSFGIALFLGGGLLLALSALLSYSGEPLPVMVLIVGFFLVVLGMGAFTWAFRSK
ncbi:hypothetical protein CAI21_21895 [Alkalilimnicola ehrlichii]|uniref:Uncharacterized protein n=1 Tax=Alkalilimnicola ehrlichii TaxID=351052 RepID=A0A3E0WHK7_9GAMM|nr:hypothetical protein [Alkalilimnicola ehrlichii]RFA24363.1 hypothetical protein CAI21_21895 [Alkalilimnicola ehrlichii]RFA31627.1 hypothetical protein CAL65_22030 [Alkalilimnicola ehrlichii]